MNQRPFVRNGNSMESAPRLRFGMDVGLGLDQSCQHGRITVQCCGVQRRTQQSWVTRFFGPQEGGYENCEKSGWLITKGSTL